MKKLTFLAIFLFGVLNSTAFAGNKADKFFDEHGGKKPFFYDARRNWEEANGGADESRMSIFGLFEPEERHEPTKDSDQHTLDERKHQKILLD
jgi:hypothetical protein